MSGLCHSFCSALTPHRLDRGPRQPFEVLPIKIERLTTIGAADHRKHNKPALLPRRDQILGDPLFVGFVA